MFKPTPTQEFFISNFALGKRAGVFMASTTSDHFSGRNLSINGNEFLSFASCGYLGLELDERVVEASVDATRRYGTTFTTSRAYLQHGLYEELEDRFEQAFGAPCIIGASTTLSHLSVFPSLVRKEDAIITDRQAHNSLQDAVTAMVGRGVHNEIVPHNDMLDLRGRIEKLSAVYDKVWYVADGIYSIYGDFAPFKELKSLLEDFPKLILYVDDAHGMGWTGKNGCGLALQELGHHERLILVTSLSKAGACGGGLIVLPDEKTKNLVRATGKTLTFSGPLTPGQLGALTAVADILLSNEISDMQNQLFDLCTYFVDQAEISGLTIIDKSISPIFYVSIGDPHLLAEVTAMIQKNHKIFVTPTGFPAVPKDQCGIRLTITRLHTKENVDALVRAIAVEHKAALQRRASAVNPD